MLGKLARLLTYEAILVLAWFFAGSFSLVFLIREGYSIQQAAWLYLLEYLLATLLVLVFSRTRFPRADVSMTLGLILLGVSFGCFLFLSGHALLNAVPVLIALSVVLFWIPFSIAMIDLTTAKNRGLIISVSFLVFPIVYFLGPLAGGATIQNLGYDVLFSVALILLIVTSTLVLLTWRKFARKYTPRVQRTEVKSYTSAGFFLEGIQEGVFTIAIPLATFLFVGEEFELGKILAAIGVAGGVMSVVAGKLSDRKGNRMLFINLAALICGPLLLLAAFVSNLVAFGITIGVIYFFLPLLPIFLFALAMDRAASSQNAIMVRELTLNAGRTLGAFLCLLLTLFVSVQATLVVAGVSLLIVPLVGLKRR